MAQVLKKAQADEDERQRKLDKATLESKKKDEEIGSLMSRLGDVVGTAELLKACLCPSDLVELVAARYCLLSLENIATGPERLHAIGEEAEARAR